MNQQDLDTVRRGYEAFGRGDLNAVLDLMDENVEWRTPGPPDLPTAGRRRGREQVAQFFASLSEVFDTLRFEPRSFIADEGRVVVLGDETVRVKASGKLLDLPWAHVYAIRNGKVIDFEAYSDVSEVVAQIRSARAST